MKKIILAVFLVLASSLGSFAQYGFDIEKEEQSGTVIFKGRCLFDDLNEEASFDWLTLGSASYNPDPATIEQLKKVLPQCELVIFMGTWCEDTQNLLPKLYKTMLLSRCYTNYKMYGLDRSKQSKDNEQAQFGIKNIPVIIVMKEGKELGRITEMVKENVEKDLLHIVAPK